MVRKYVAEKEGQSLLKENDNFLKKLGPLKGQVVYLVNNNLLIDTEYACDEVILRLLKEVTLEREPGNGSREP